MQQGHGRSRADAANEDCPIDVPERNPHSLALRPPLLDPAHGGDYHTGFWAQPARIGLKAGGGDPEKRSSGETVSRSSP
jgi:hypothetical protein